MTTLPSFVELMESLGLDSSRSRSGPAGYRTPAHHSRSSSYSSSSSLFSQASGSVPVPPPTIYPHALPVAWSPYEQYSVDRDWESERHRSHPGRYSPYSPSLSHARKASMPSMISEETAREHPLRALSTSPYISSSPRIGRRSSSMAPKAAARRPENLMSGANFTANTPISTFARRKTPQASPVSPTFPHRTKNRAISPSAPVSIPTVPLVFPPHSRYPSSDSDDDDTVSTADASSRYHTFPRHTIKISPPLPQYDSFGVRISAFARPRDMESQHFSHITPIA